MANEMHVPEKTVNKNPVRIFQDTYEGIRDEQTRRRKATGKEPTQAELLKEAWDFFAQNHLAGSPRKLATRHPRTGTPKTNLSVLPFEALQTTLLREISGIEDPVMRRAAGNLASVLIDMLPAGFSGPIGTSGTAEDRGDEPEAPGSTEGSGKKAG